MGSKVLTEEGTRFYSYYNLIIILINYKKFSYSFKNPKEGLLSERHLFYKIVLFFLFFCLIKYLIFEAFFVN